MKHAAAHAGKIVRHAPERRARPIILAGGCCTSCCCCSCCLHLIGGLIGAAMIGAGGLGGLVGASTLPEAIPAPPSTRIRPEAGGGPMTASALGQAGVVFLEEGGATPKPSAAGKPKNIPLSVSGRAQALYWKCLVLATVVAAVFAGMWKGLLGLVGMVFLGLPAVQILASAAAFAWIALNPSRDQRMLNRVLLRMTWRALLGTIIGAGLMTPCLWQWNRL